MLNVDGTEKTTQLQITAVFSGIFQNMIFTEFQLPTKGPLNKNMIIKTIHHPWDMSWGK